MPNWIQNICEPARLILAWQAPDPDGERKRFAVGELTRAGADATLRYADGPEIEEAKQLGFVGYPAFKLDRREHPNALSTFMRRLPPRGRTDFTDYMAHFRLPANVTLSDFALLAYTEAKLPSDGFSLVNSLDDMQMPCEFVLEVAGYRHYAKKVPPIQIGQVVEVEAEPTNKWDPNAIAIKAGGAIIGYVNRLQTRAFQKWMRDGAIVCVIERLNGTSPRPRAFIFVWIKKTQSQAA